MVRDVFTLQNANVKKDTQAIFFLPSGQTDLERTFVVARMHFFLLKIFNSLLNYPNEAF